MERLLTRVRLPTGRSAGGPDQRRDAGRMTTLGPTADRQSRAHSAV
jgi:hypothetical protein